MEWSAFHDAFVAAVHNSSKLSRVQKLTHLRSYLEGNAYRCIEAYAVVNDHYEKALQDLTNRFGRKRLVIGELVKSIVELKIADGSDSKGWRTLYDTLSNRVRSLESHGLPIKDNPSLTMVLLPIFELKLPGELREKCELLDTKQDSINEKSVGFSAFFEFLEGHVLSEEALETVVRMKSTIKPRKIFPKQQFNQHQRKETKMLPSHQPYWTPTLQIAG